MLRKNTKGFTIVELLVCVVVIIILIAVLLPLYNQYIDRARKSQILADGRSAAVATQSVYHEYYAFHKLFLLDKDDRVNNDWGIEHDENAGYQLGEWVGVTKAAYDDIFLLAKISGVITRIEYNTDNDTLAHIEYFDPESGFSAVFDNGRWTTP